MQNDIVGNIQNEISAIDSQLQCWNDALRRCNSMIEDYSTQVQDILRWVTQLNARIDIDHAKFKEKLELEAKRSMQQRQETVKTATSPQVTAQQTVQPVKKAKNIKVEKNVTVSSAAKMVEKPPAAAQRQASMMLELDAVLQQARKIREWEKKQQNETTSGSVKEQVSLSDSPAQQQVVPEDSTNPIKANQQEQQIFKSKFLNIRTHYVKNIQQVQQQHEELERLESVATERAEIFVQRLHQHAAQIGQVSRRDCDRIIYSSALECIMNLEQVLLAQVFEFVSDEDTLRIRSNTSLPIDRIFENAYETFNDASRSLSYYENDAAVRRHEASCMQVLFGKKAPASQQPLPKQVPIAVSDIKSKLRSETAQFTPNIAVQRWLPHDVTPDIFRVLSTGECALWQGTSSMSHAELKLVSSLRHEIQVLSMRQHIQDAIARGLLPQLEQLHALYSASMDSSAADRATIKKTLLHLWRMIHSIITKNGNNMCTFMPKKTLVSHGFGSVFDRSAPEADDTENEPILLSSDNYR